jgi:hypothetical protein
VNEGRIAVDVTLLFIDAGYGITAWYPKPGTSTDNRLEPRAPKNKLGPPDVPRSIVTADTTGLEHIVLIAVKAEGPPLDFTWLAQPSIAAARAVSRGGTTSPLTALFENAAYRTRGKVAEDTLSPFAIRTISWKVPPK